MPKRTQFSSCDRCRRSRLGCDASFVDQVGSAMTCTRCKKHNQHCSFNWMKNVTVPESSKRAQARQLRSRHRAHKSSERDTASPSASLSDIHLVGSDVVSPIGTGSDTQTQATATCFNGTTAQHAVSSQSDLFRDRASKIIYENCFDVVFGSWMGCHGCPFVLADSNHAKEHVHIAETCSRLDAWITEASMDDPEHAQGLQQQNKKTDESLNQAILAFSIRWLPIVDKSRNNDSVFEAEVASAWRQARRDMLRIINRPSYRSVLSLFLFAVTPIPIGISVDEEADGISGQACISAALQQIQALRARQRELRFNGSNVSPAVSQKQITVRLEPLLSPEFLMAESTAFWAALTFDTSASLTLNCRPVLSSGLFGFEFESPWRLVRAESKTFQQTYDTWKNSGESINITDDKANHIIASATGWKLLAWKLTAVFKEAIRDAHNESEVKKTHESIVLCMEEFDSIYRGPLQACFDRMHFLKQEVKLRWFSVMLHYHLSILILMDTLEACNRVDLLASLRDAADKAQNVVLNTLVFGLQNEYEITITPTIAQPSPGAPPAKGASHVPIVAIDPYPHHIIASVQLLRKAIESDLRRNKISSSVYSNIHSRLEQVLQWLPKTSKSLQAAMKSHG